MSARIRRLVKIATVASVPVLLAGGVAGIAHSATAAPQPLAGVLDLVGWATQNGGTTGGGTPPHRP